MLKKFLHIKQKFNNNIKIVENYFFMTSLQLFSSLIGILIYPYLIRVLGPQSYGSYVFALSVISYFIGLVSFGFSFPALKAIVENKHDIIAKSNILSSVFTAKCLIALISSFLFTGMILTIPFLRDNWFVFVICFTQIVAEVLFPIWYFQGMQKMYLVTIIQLGLRIISLPFIFIFVNSSDDIGVFVLITSFFIVLGGIISVLYLIFNDKITFRFVPFKELKKYFKDALPFFWSSVTSTIKLESATIIIGSFFSMSDVALYDLANKIITIPRMFTLSINSALFPKLVENINNNLIKKIIKYEAIIGVSIIVIIIVFGKWIVLLMGGESMEAAFPLAIILSTTIVTWLVIGSYINFIFVPKNRYYFVSKNQLVAFITFFMFCIFGLFIYNSIFIVVASISLSGICEIVYSRYLIKKHNLL